MALILYRPSLRASLAIVVLLGWGGSLGWLAWRQVHADRATDLSSEAALRLAPGGGWFAIDAGSVQVGSGGITLDTLSPGYRIVATETFEVPRDGRLTRTTWRSETHLDATLGLEGITARSSMPGRAVDWSVIARGDSIMVSSLDGTRRAVGKLHLDARPVAQSALSYRLALSGVAASGRSRTVLVADGWPPAVVEAPVVAGRDSTIDYADSSRTDPVEGWVAAHQTTAHAVALDIVGPLGPYRLWVDHRGNVLGRQTPLGVTWVRTDFDLAISRFQRRVAADPGSVAAALPAMRLLAASRLIDTSTAPRRYLALHRDGTPVDTALLAGLSGGRQTVHGDTITVGPEVSHPVVITPREVPEDPMIQSDAHAVRTFAASFDGMVAESVGLMALIDTIRRTVRLDTAIGAPQDALGTLAAHRGRPDGIARLFVAAARAAGIPARYVTGVAVRGDTLYPHAWAEVWSPGGRGGWFAVDPVRGLVPAPTNLIRLALAGSGGRDGMLPLVANARLVPLPTTGDGVIR